MLINNQTNEKKNTTILSVIQKQYMVLGGINHHQLS